MAIDADHEKIELANRLAEQQANALTQPKNSLKTYIKASNQAAESVQLDETSTRKLINEQLRQAAWEVDSVELVYSSSAGCGKPSGDLPDKCLNSFRQNCRRFSSESMSTCKEILNPLPIFILQFYFWWTSIVNSQIQRCFFIYLI
jgi:hypothetical protein